MTDRIREVQQTVNLYWYLYNSPTTPLVNNLVAVAVMIIATSIHQMARWCCGASGPVC